MNLADVLTEIIAAVATTGLRVPERLGDRPASGSPSALVELPTEIGYDTGGPGFDRYPDVQVIVMGGVPTRPDSLRALAPYADGAGPLSVKQAVQTYPYASCGRVRVARTTPEVVTIHGVDQLAFVFHCDVTGRSNR